EVRRKLRLSRDMTQQRQQERGGSHKYFHGRISPVSRLSGRSGFGCGVAVDRSVERVLIQCERVGDERLVGRKKIGRSIRRPGRVFKRLRDLPQGCSISNSMKPRSAMVLLGSAVGWRL